MRIILLGPPGAGKGTQAALLVQRLMVPHISTGDIFRQAISEGSPLGEKAKAYIDRGHLVPDDVTVGVFRERIAQEDCREGFLSDGFPRTRVQAEALAEILTGMGIHLDAVINLVVPRELLLSRLTGRRICRSCGASYHLVFSPPPVEGICGKCGGELYHRSDDSKETVGSRLTLYENQTAPLIAYYGELGLLRKVPGDGPIDQVLQAIGKSLGRSWA